MGADRQDRPGMIPEIDFDYNADPELWNEPWDHWDVLRRRHRFARTTTGTAAPTWLLSRYDDIHEVFQNPGLFSSRSVTPAEAVDAHRWIPEELDPPDHARYRHILMPFFTPGAVKDLEPRLRAWCIELVEKLAPEGGCDVVTAFARRYPTYIFMGLFGLPVAEADTLLGWADALMHTSQADDPDRRQRGDAAASIAGFLTSLLAARRRDPRHDICSYLVHAEIDGRPLPDDELLSYAFLLYMGGLDTVAGVLGCAFRHLATRPADRTRLVGNPGLIPAAVEELLRYYAIVTTGRLVTADTDFHGCPMRAGDRVLLPTVSANRDPAAFPAADEFRLDRAANRHLAFGAGPHRCLGSHLARAELAIALEEWHARIPDYRLAGPDTVVTHAGGVAGYDSVLLAWP